MCANSALSFKTGDKLRQVIALKTKQGGFSDVEYVTLMGVLFPMYFGWVG